MIRRDGRCGSSQSDSGARASLILWRRRRGRRRFRGLGLAGPVRDPCRLFQRWGRGMLINVSRRTIISSGERLEIPISMAQIPEPAPTSSILFGSFSGLRWSFPPKSNLVIPCCMSILSSSSSSQGYLYATSVRIALRRALD